MPKKKPSQNEIVYSTNPSFIFHSPEEEIFTLPPNEQKLNIKLETKHRAGKIVTIIEGFQGSEEDILLLTKALKNYCGTGGSYKGNSIIIQGDNRTKLLQFLKQNNYVLTQMR